MMITGLLAGAAKTLVVSMLSERVVLRVLVMLSDHADRTKWNQKQNYEYEFHDNLIVDRD